MHKEGLREVKLCGIPSSASVLGPFIDAQTSAGLQIAVGEEGLLKHTLGAPHPEFLSLF